jgi:hypothetical protein
MSDLDAQWIEAEFFGEVVMCVAGGVVMLAMVVFTLWLIRKACRDANPDIGFVAFWAGFATVGVGVLVTSGVMYAGKLKLAPLTVLKERDEREAKRK